MTLYQQIRRHVDSAQRLIAWWNADISFGGEDDQDAADHLKQAYEHLDAAKELIEQHKIAVRYQTVREGVLTGVYACSPNGWYGPADWAEVRDSKTAAILTVQWRHLEEAL